MLKDKVDTVILDVDGTLSDDVSWLPLTEGLGASPKEHQKIFDAMKAEELTYPEAKAKLLELWQATGNANKDFMEEMFRSWELKPDAEETVAYLNERYTVCLISGAVDLYVQVVAEKLGVEDWYANTELVWDESGNLIDFHYYVDQAQLKLDQLEEYLKEKGLDKERCLVVGDGDSDIVLFRELKYGIAVNREPYPELEELAHTTISNLKELKELL